MKLSKLAQICKKVKQIHIMDDKKVNPGTQWDGDGAAFYSFERYADLHSGNAVCISWI